MVPHPMCPGRLSSFVANLVDAARKHVDTGPDEDPSTLSSEETHSDHDVHFYKYGFGFLFGNGWYESFSLPSTQSFPLRSHSPLSQQHNTPLDLSRPKTRNNINDQPPHESALSRTVSAHSFHLLHSSNTHIRLINTSFVPLAAKASASTSTSDSRSRPSRTRRSTSRPSWSDAPGS